MYVNVPKSRFIIGSQPVAPSTGTLRSMWSLKNVRSSSVTYLRTRQENGQKPSRTQSDTGEIGRQMAGHVRTRRLLVASNFDSHAFAQAPTSRYGTTLSR